MTPQRVRYTLGKIESKWMTRQQAAAWIRRARLIMLAECLKPVRKERQP